MASWIKAWKRKHPEDTSFALSNNIDLVRCYGQLSWLCMKCGCWWSVKLGVEHICKEVHIDAEYHCSRSSCEAQ